MKRRIGIINGKPIIEGDSNILNKNEISYIESGNFINLKERDKNGNLKSLNADYSFIIPHSYPFNCECINYDKFLNYKKFSDFLNIFTFLGNIKGSIKSMHSIIICEIITDHKIKEIRFKGKNCCGYFLINKNGDSQHINISNKAWPVGIDDFIKVSVENFKSGAFIPLRIAANKYNSWSIEIIDSNDKVFTYTGNSIFNLKMNNTYRFNRTIQESQWV